MTLQEISDALEATPSDWNGLPPALKAEIRDKVKERPGKCFDAAQRVWFRKWWLRVTPAVLASINAALPAKVRLTGRRDINNLLFLNADLLTDCQAGETYDAVKETLHQLPIRLKLASEWPAAATALP